MVIISTSFMCLGSTPLILSSWNGQMNITKELLDNPKTDPNIRNNVGK